MRFLSDNGSRTVGRQPAQKEGNSVDSTTKKWRLWSWALYDAGNSAFATTVMAAVLPVYYREVAARGLSMTTALAYWGYASAAALAISVVTAPFSGAAADARGWKKRGLFWTTLLGIFASAGLAWIGEGQWLGALLLLVTGTVGFSLSSVFYDSLLPHLATPSELDGVSSRGYAVGYLGGGILLAINVAMIAFLPPEKGMRLSFLTVAVWWAMFTLPIMAAIPEPPSDFSGDCGMAGVLSRPLMTLRSLRRFPDAFLFLVAFWLFNDGIGTVIKLGALYASALGIGREHLLGALLATQFVAIPFALGFGRLAGKIGAKPSIFIGLAGYVCLSVWAFFLVRPWQFWALAIGIGTVQGGTQALSRSLFGSMIPPGRSAEFFAFYDLSSKFSGIAGPALFAVILQITGSPRYGALALSLFFLSGMAVLRRVNVERGRSAFL
jgi:UMF1 family MFS transporter